MNQLDEKTGFSLEWLDFGGDMTAMSIVAGIAAIGILIFFFTRRNIE